MSTIFYFDFDSTSAHNAMSMSGVLLYDFRSLYSVQINNIMFPSHLSDTTIQLKERLDANDVARVKLVLMNSAFVLTIAA